MKTVKDVWMLVSGDYRMYFDKKETAMLQLADQGFLESVPDKTVFTIEHGYMVVDFEVPGMGYYDGPKDQPKLIGYAH